MPGAVDPSRPGHRSYGTINGVGHVGTTAEVARDAANDAAWAGRQQAMLDLAARQRPGSVAHVRAMRDADGANREDPPTPRATSGRYPARGR